MRGAKNWDETSRLRVQERLSLLQILRTNQSVKIGLRLYKIGLMMLTEPNLEITFINLQKDHRFESNSVTCQYPYSLLEGVYLAIFSATSVGRHTEFICKHNGNLFQNSTPIPASSLPF